MAIAYVKTAGPDKAVAEFSNKDSGTRVNKDMYVVVLKTDGTILAHGVNKALIGKIFIAVKDLDGELYTQEIIELAKKGGGWMDYKFTDPVTKKIIPKSAYSALIPGFDGVLFVGYYK